jgi:RNA polymerase sigma-70 factor (ECF subfamily)
MLDLVRRFQGQVFGLCFRMLGTREDAEDAAQETFVRVLRSLSRWDPAREFEPWLLTIAGNRCRTALASRRQRRDVGTLEFVELAEEEGEQAAAELAEELRRALAALRPEYREAFELFHEREMSYGEIAEALHVPLGTVKTWVHRARRELIEAMQAREMLEVRHHAVR